jgi:hypothetical protein
MKKTVIIGILLMLPIFACNNNNSGNIPTTKDDDPKKKLSKNEQKYFEDVVMQTIEGFTSSIEIAAIINDLKMPYSQKYLIPVEAVPDFDTNFKKALGLGMLSVDLGYLNVYKKMSSNIKYLSAIRDLADDLDIDSYFDFQTLKRLASSGENMDSLMFLSVSSYHKMNQHLMETERSHLSALVITGVWLEGLHLICQVNKSKADPRLRDRIAEQKDIIETLLTILVFYQDKNHFKSLLDDLIKLKNVYSQITEVVTKENATETVNSDGIPIINQNVSSQLQMSDSQLQQIVSLVEEIRDKRIKGVE